MSNRLPGLFSPILLTCTAAVFLLMACETSRKTIRTETPSYKDSLTMALDSFAKKSLIPGFAVAVVCDKGVLYEKGWGLADINEKTAFTPLTINGVASVSKTFVALCIMKLVEEKKLGLDDPVNAVLPFKIINPYYPDVPVTVRHLVTHTSSIIDDAFVPYYIGEADICIINDHKKYDSLPAYLQPNLAYYRMGKRITLEEHIRKYTERGAKWYTDSTFLNKPPGTYFQYSNLGAAIAARIVEIKSGMNFIDYTKKHIFTPLKMKNTGWNVEDLDAGLVTKIYAHNDDKMPTGVVEHPQYYMTNYPVSGLKTNAADLSSYLMEMMKGYEGRGRLLKKESYELLFKAQPDVTGLLKSDSSNFNGHYSIAVFWSVTASGQRLHFGGNTGVYSVLYFNPKTKKGALAYSNLRDDSFGELLRLLYKYEPGIDKK